MQEEKHVRFIDQPAVVHTTFDYCWKRNLTRRRSWAEIAGSAHPTVSSTTSAPPQQPQRKVSINTNFQDPSPGLRMPVRQVSLALLQDASDHGVKPSSRDEEEQHRSWGELGTISDDAVACPPTIPERQISNPIPQLSAVRCSPSETKEMKRSDCTKKSKTKKSKKEKKGSTSSKRKEKRSNKKSFLSGFALPAIDELESNMDSITEGSNIEETSQRNEVWLKYEALRGGVDPLLLKTRAMMPPRSYAAAVPAGGGHVL